MSNDKQLTGIARVIAAFKKQAANPAAPGDASSKSPSHSPALEKVAAAFRKEAGTAAPQPRVEPVGDPSKLTGLARTIAAFQRDSQRAAAPSPASRPAATTRPANDPTAAASNAMLSDLGFPDGWLKITASAGSRWTPEAIRQLIRSPKIEDKCAAHAALQEVGPRFPGVMGLITELFESILPANA